MFGRFWEHRNKRLDIIDETWGILREIDSSEDPVMYSPCDGLWYPNFEPGLPKGFDSKGRPV